MRVERIAICRDGRDKNYLRITVLGEDDVVIDSFRIDKPTLYNMIAHFDAGDTTHIFELRRRRAPPPAAKTLPTIIAKPDWTVTAQGNLWRVVDGKGWTMRDGFRSNEEAWRWIDRHSSERN